MAMGFLFAMLLISRMCRFNGQNSEFYSSLVTWILISAILGARIAYVLEHWQLEFKDSPMSIFRIDRGGLMFYGGFIAAALATFAYAKLHGKRIFEVTDVLVTVLPLGHMFGRIGCFFHGCCYGDRTGSIFGVSFPSQSPAWIQQLNDGLISRSASCSLPVIPVQLVEAGLNLLMFLVLYKLYRRAFRHKGIATAFYLISYASVRFITEYLRGDSRLTVGGFSIGQTISIGLFATGMAIFLLRRRDSRLPDQES